MTKPIVPSITDEQLEKLERAVQAAPRSGAFGQQQFPLIMAVQGLIARLRAAEKDAARYRWIKSESKPIRITQDQRVGDLDVILQGGAADYFIDHAMMCEQKPWEQNS